MKKNKMTVDEIVTYVLKTGKFPDNLKVLPKEKVTLQKNGTFTIRYRDIYDEFKKDDPLKGLNNEQFNLIASNIPDFHKRKEYIEKMDILHMPEKYISLLKTEHAEKVVFTDRNPGATEFMKYMLIKYLRICVNPEKYINTDDEMNKRIIKYLQTQYDWMLETLGRIFKMEKQPSPIDKDITDKKLTMRQKVEDAFSFMQNTDPRKHKLILNETDFDNLVNWVTHYFENDFKLPEINKPIQKVYTDKGNVVYTFKWFFKQEYPVMTRPDSLFQLIKACFYEYRDDNIKNYKKQKEPQYYKDLMHNE